MTTPMSSPQGLIVYKSSSIFFRISSKDFISVKIFFLCFFYALIVLRFSVGKLTVELIIFKVFHRHLLRQFRGLVPREIFRNIGKFFSARFLSLDVLKTI